MSVQPPVIAALSNTATAAGMVRRHAVSHKSDKADANCDEDACDDNECDDGETSPHLQKNQASIWPSSVAYRRNDREPAG